MSLYDFGYKDEKYTIFLKKLKEIGDKADKKGFFKALEVLTPDKLEKIKISAKNREGLRKKIEIFVDTEEEVKLLAEFFHYNPTTSQILDVKFLLFILKELKKYINGKKL